MTQQQRSDASAKCSDGKDWARVAKGRGCSNFQGPGGIQLTDTWYDVGSANACGKKCSEMKSKGC